jgi:hypothetical protein
VKLDERLDPGDLNRPPAVAAAETHRTGAGANGVVGSQNQRGRYGAGAVLWTSDQFHERTDSGGDTRNRVAEAKFAARWTSRTSSDPQEKETKGTGFKGQSQ